MFEIQGVGKNFSGGANMTGKSTKILCLLVALSLCLAVVISGCGAGKEAEGKKEEQSTQAAAGTKNEKPSKAVELRYAHAWSAGDPKYPFFNPVLEKYAQDNKDKVKLVIEMSNGDEIRTKMKVDTAAGNVADVFNYWCGPFVQPLMDANILLEVDKYFEKSSTVKRDQYDALSIEAFSMNGKMIGLPVEGFATYFMVNKELFQKYNLQYPKTYEDLLAVSKVFQQNGVIPFAMSCKGGNPGHVWFSELFNQMSDAFDEMKNLKANYKFDTDNALKIAQIIDDCRKAGVYPQDTISNGDWNPQFALFTEGKAAMVYSGTWMLPSIKEDMMDKVEVIETPKLTGAANDPGSFYTGAAAHGYFINRKSFEDPEKQQAVVDFVDFLCSDTALGALMKASTVIVKKGVDTTSYPKMLAKVMEFNKNQSSAQLNINYFPNDESMSLYQSTMDELFAGAIDPKGFVEKVQKVVEAARK